MVAQIPTKPKDIPMIGLRSFWESNANQSVVQYTVRRKGKGKVDEKKKKRVDGFDDEDEDLNVLGMPLEVKG